VAPYSVWGPAATSDPREAFHRPGWVYEEKVDGWRLVACKAVGRVRLVSRKGVEHTVRFPHLVKAIAALPGTTLVLDGEVAVFDERLVSRFDLLGEPGSGVPTTRPLYVAFDVLYASGRDLRAQPLEKRREVLERLVADAGLVFLTRPEGRNRAEALRLRRFASE
jgi:bifunctional non-homologous end joining protein LigD